MKINPHTAFWRKIWKVPALVALALSATFTTGCATVTRGTTEQLLVQSDPTGATVRLSNGFTGVTPATFTVPRKGDLVVSFSMEGYESSEVTVASQLSGTGTAGFVGNVLLGGVIGGVTDVVTGATLSHVPNPVKVTLVPKRNLNATDRPPDPPKAPAPSPSDQRENAIKSEK